MFLSGDLEFSLSHSILAYIRFLQTFHIVALLLAFSLSHNILVCIRFLQTFHLVALLLASAHQASAPASGQQSSESAQREGSNPKQSLWKD